MLLEALRAGHVVPKLWRRLSFERYEATATEIEILRDWPQSLMFHQACWRTIEAVLDTPEAWPHAWHQAAMEGWPAQSHHHHALLFWEFTARFLHDKEYEHAAWSWEQTLYAWEGFLGDRTYVTELLCALVDVPEKKSAVAEEFGPVVRELPLPMIHTLLKRLRESAGLDRPGGIRAGVDKRALRFTWWALGEVSRWKGAGAGDPFGALSRAAEQADAGRTRVAQDVVERWVTAVEAMDLSEVTQAQAALPFELLHTTAEVVGIDAASAIKVVEKVVEVGWKLEKLGRAGAGGVLDDVVGSTRVFNDALEGHIASGAAFGHQAKCADFLVFEGDLSKDRAVRFALFARALEVCPGHRNAALLLGHEHLQQVAGMGGQAEAMGALGLMLPRSRDRLRDLVKQMHHHLEQAWAVYPFDEDFGTYALKVNRLAQKLEMQLPAPPQGWQRAMDEAKEKGGTP